MKSKITYTFVFLLVSFISNAQCAMCRAVLESEEGQSAAEGINNGIVYLMVIPYLLVGGVGFLVYKKLKNK
jgi:heme/copper-type cytochrome/quinol oxidase subunit 2